MASSIPPLSARCWPAWRWRGDVWTILLRSGCGASAERSTEFPPWGHFQSPNDRIGLRPSKKAALGVRILRFVVGCAAALWLGLAAADASPWAEVGDSQLRSDIQILAQAGILDDITTPWAIPWA